MVVLYLTVAKLDTNPCFIMKLTNIECFLQISRSRRIQAVKRFPLKMYNTALSINSLPLIISHKHVFEVSSRVYLPTPKSCVCVWISQQRQCESLPKAKKDPQLVGSRDNSLWSWNNSNNSNNWNYYWMKSSSPLPFTGIMASLRTIQ